MVSRALWVRRRRRVAFELSLWVLVLVVFVCGWGSSRVVAMSGLEEQLRVLEVYQAELAGEPGGGYVHGVEPADLGLYSTSPFRCVPLLTPAAAALEPGDVAEDGGEEVVEEEAELPLARVNDGFCDCADGSDEPGTAACPTGRFRCLNRGFRRQWIPSSQVGDGVCDCCDGSDELVFEGGAPSTGRLSARAVVVSCPNKCDELARVVFEEMEKELSDVEAGLRARETMLDKIKEKRAELEGKREELTHKIEAKKAKIEEAEAKAKAEEDEAKAKAQAEEEAVEQQAETTEAAEAPTIPDAPALFPYPQQYAAPTAEEDKPKPNPKPAKEEPKPVRTIFTDVARVASTLLDSLVSIGKPIAALFKPKREESRAGRSVEGMKRDLGVLEKKARELDELLRSNFGPRDMLLAMHEQCYEIDDNEYTWEMCPLASATQKKLGGGGRTHLGKYKSYNGVSHVMTFTGGKNCWRGPERSLKVQLECGSAHRILDVTEPSRCEYHMRFTSPLVCEDAHADALRLNLEAGILPE